MLLPFAAVPIEIGFNPTFLDGVMVVLFAVWLVQLASQGEHRALSTPLTLPLLAFTLLAFVSFVGGLAHAGLTKNVIRHFAEVVVSILLFFVVQDGVRQRKTLERMARAIILIGFLSAAMGVVLYFLPQSLAVRLLSSLRVFNYPSGVGVLRFIEDDPSLPMRAVSSSVDPNVLGGLLILVTSLTIPQLFTRYPLMGRFWAGSIALLMSVCMVLTFSRGSIVGLGTALLFIALVRYRRLLIVLVLTGIALVLLPQTQVLITHFWQGFLLQDRATLMRLGEYRDALALISQHPWFGVGFAGSPSIELYIGVSSVYLLMAEEMGLVGLGAFLVVLSVLFLYTWPRLRSPEEDSIYAISLGLQGALVGALVGGIFDHYFFNLDFPHSVALFWFYVGLAVAAARLISQGRAGETTLTEEVQAAASASRRQG
jgi:O-antigen ligase